MFQSRLAGFSLCHHLHHVHVRRRQHRVSIPSSGILFVSLPQVALFSRFRQVFTRISPLFPRTVTRSTPKRHKSRLATHRFDLKTGGLRRQMRLFSPFSALQNPTLPPQVGGVARMVATHSQTCRPPGLRRHTPIYSPPMTVAGGNSLSASLPAVASIRPTQSAHRV